MTSPTPMHPPVPRGLGQGVAFGSAILFYLCAVLCLAGLFLWVGELGGGLVQHVIGRANLPRLSFSSAEEGSMTPRDFGR